MLMGMTYDEFWHSPTVVHQAYRKAWKLRQRADEWDRWRRGMYVYDALLRVAPVMRASFSKQRVEPGEYPEEPYPLTIAEARERDERKRLQNMERFFKQLETESEQERARRAKEKEQGEVSDDA